MNLYQRPQPDMRTFRCEGVEAFIACVAEQLPDEQIRRMFINCYPNTLDTTVRHRELEDGTPDTFIITGDIPAMWLRDAAAQVWPYLHLLGPNPPLRRMVEGVIRRMARSVLIDPYANAFLDDPMSLDTEFARDHTTMAPGVYERKWEVDSLAYVLRLSHGYWRCADGDIQPFDATWLAAVEAILDTFDQQRGPEAYHHYTFARTTAAATDTLGIRGRGNPGRPCGMIRSAFRCSDDASIFPYIVPANLMAAAELTRIAELLDVLESPQLAQRARQMGTEIHAAVEAHGIVRHPTHGLIYAYETDGYHAVVLMDDAGIPGLLSLPYLGAVPIDSAIYRNTRRFALSDDNPYFFRGRAVSGIGSPHTAHGWVWPMSLLARGLTATRQDTRERMVRTLARIDGGAGFVHESIDPDQPERYTRAWFAWVNGLFGELVAGWVGQPLYRTQALPERPTQSPVRVVIPARPPTIAPVKAAHSG